MNDICKQLVEDAHYLESVGMSREQLSQLHHSSLNGGMESFGGTYSYFGKSKSLRQNNIDYAERLRFVADKHKQGEHGIAFLIQQALRKWPLIPSSVITIFKDDLQANAHRLFQMWRAANPSGFFINREGQKNNLLHCSPCSHFGGTDLLTEENGSLTAKRKVCARTTLELRSWASERGLSIRECKNCVFDDNSPDILSPSEYASRLDEILTLESVVAIQEEFGSITPGRIPVTVSRIIRDTRLARIVKELHGFRCQICDHTIPLPDGSFYAEAHHIRPLGSPHDGPDSLENILCVCPNHHIELDYRLRRLIPSQLHTAAAHKVSRNHVDYHNALVDSTTAV